MPEIKFYNRAPVPMEMHKVKIVQKLTLLPGKERLAKLKEAGFNTFLLHNGDIFMDMLTDSGVNAMSDNMQSAMLRADDAYAGSETFYRMRDKLEEIFGTGTAAVISPVGKLRYKDDVMVIGDGGIGPVSQKIYDTVTGIQLGKIEDPFGWRVVID